MIIGENVSRCMTEIILYNMFYCNALITGHCFVFFCIGMASPRLSITVNMYLAVLMTIDKCVRFVLVVVISQIDTGIFHFPSEHMPFVCFNLNHCLLLCVNQSFSACTAKAIRCISILLLYSQMLNVRHFYFTIDN